MLPGRLPSNPKEQYVPVDYYRNRLLYDPDSDPLIDKFRSVGLILLQNHILDKKETQAVLYTTCVNTATNITLLL